MKKAFNGDNFEEIYRSIEYEESPSISTTFADIMIYNKEYKFCFFFYKKFLFLKMHS
jgi:hypothetical protein